MPKFSQLRPGDVLWDCRRVEGRWCFWEVRIASLDPERRTAMCSWNGNRLREYYEGALRKLSWIPKAVRGRCVRCGKPRTQSAKKYRVEAFRPEDPEKRFDPGEVCRCAEVPEKVRRRNLKQVERK